MRCERAGIGETDRATVRAELLLFWSLNEECELPEMKRQIDGFCEKGITGFFLHSRAGREIDYLGPEWEAMCAGVLDYARRKGMHVWIYDEDGWPSGFAGGAVPSADQGYCIKRMGYGAACPPDACLLAAYREEAGGMIRCSPGQATRFCYFRPDKHYADLMDPETVKAFIGFTHEWYKRRFSEYFGEVILGVFTDEPQLNMFGWTWTPLLRDAYRSAYGRDILDDLWLLYEPGKGHELFRYRYDRLCALMFAESYTGQIARWCDENRLQLTGHFPCEDGMTTQVRGCGDVCLHYRHMHLPGIDYLGNRITSPVLLKQVSSVANQFGKPHVLSETFGCSGWSVTPRELLWNWSYQASQGIDTPCLHLGAYSIRGIRKRDYPAFFSYQNSWWPYMSGFAGAMKKIGSFLPRLDIQNSVLVVSPMQGVFYHDGEANGEHAANDSAQYRVLLENLLDVQIPFDVGDPFLMEEQARIIDGRLRLGDGRYETVVVAQTAYMSDVLQSLIDRFAQDGGRVIYIGRLPSTTYKSTGQQRVLIQNRRELLRKYFDKIHFARPVTVVDENGRLSDQSIVTYDLSASRVMVWNGETDAQRRLYIKRDGDRYPERWDPHENAWFPLFGCFAAEGATVAPLTLFPQECLLLRYRAEYLPAEVTDGPAFVQTDLIPCKVELASPNVLTLDSCRYRIDGGGWSCWQNVLHTHESLYTYARKNHRNCEAVYEYTFTVQDDDVPLDSLTLCIESRSVSSIRVNGRVLIRPDIGWFVDKGIREYSIGDLAVRGCNTVEAVYTIPCAVDRVSVDGLFETERNRFFFEKEPESIYIRGRFDVQPMTAPERRLNGYRVAPGFGLVKEMPKDPMADLTAQGAWFYRGEAVYRFTLPKGSGRERLRLSAMKGSFALISVNGEPVAELFASPPEVSLKGSLIRDENVLEIRLVGNDRNLLGPHHHIKGELNFVGVDSFKGVYGWEDFVNSDVGGSSTWTDDYHFGFFRLGPVLLLA